MEKKKSPRIPTVLSVIVALSIVAALTFYVVHNATADGDAAEDQAAETQAEQEEQKDGEEKEKAPIPVRVRGIEQGRVSSYISSTTNLVAENEVRVIAEWEGRLDRLTVEEGDRIEAGQVLAQLDRTDREIALSRAQVRLENARINYERSQRLADQELLSPDAFDKVKLDYEIAKQEVAEAEHNLAKTVIRAPFGGIVTQRTAQVGQHIRPGDELFTVTDFDPLVARIYLPEKDVLSLEEGRSVRLSLKADESIQVEGRIRQISPVVDTATGTVKVTVEAVRPPAEVRPGAFVRVDIVRESRPEAVLLPKQAVVRELQKTYVFVASGGSAEKRAVSLGLEEGARVEATAGVEVGEQVIVAGQGGLKDGSPIKLLAGGDDEPDAATRLAEAR